MSYTNGYNPFVCKLLYYPSAHNGNTKEMSCCEENDPFGRPDCEESDPLGDPDDYRFPEFVSDRILVIELICPGGQAVLFRGTIHMTETEREVAIKVYDGREDFEQERDILSTIINEGTTNHPNIITAILWAEATTGPTMVMPYYKGGDLMSYIRYHGLISSHDSTEILVGLGYGLKHLHDRGIVHCDLKSANILIDEQCKTTGTLRPVITDFGCAQRVLENEEKVSEYDCYTPHWRAPETIKAKLISRKTDMYALGIVMWEILTGSFPYGGMESESILQYVLTNGGRPNSNEYPNEQTDEYYSYQVLINDLWHDKPDARPPVGSFLATILKKNGRTNSNFNR